MLVPASSEFVTLCQSQVALLTQGLGAALSIVYLKELTEDSDAKLFPVVAYPEIAAGWGEDQILTFLSRGTRRTRSQPRLLPSESPVSSKTALPALPSELEPDVYPLQAAEKALLRQQQIVLPLIHEEAVMGLLVTARADRAWNESEQAQIEEIAETLAIACVLDQRSQWLVQDLQQQELLQEQKHDVFDDLLHQFRNPLTALRTFGKLLLKRLQPSDTNYSVAEGIVRESDRLQDLLQQFDAAIDLDNTPPRLNSAESIDWNAQLESGATVASNSPSSKSILLLPGASGLMGAPIQLEPHRIAEVLEPLLDSTTAIAQDRQLYLQTDIPADLPPVQTNLKALREVLSNLLDNALKYTPAGGQVDVRVVAQPLAQESWQAVVITDTGPGIPPQDLEHLFKRHYRGVQATTAIPGTGLGLAIARDLVKQMQGEIQVFSPASTSSLRLPTDLFNSEHPGTAIVVWLLEQLQQPS
jgi:signal transduction histidine kinase